MKNSVILFSIVFVVLLSLFLLVFSFWDFSNEQIESDNVIQQLVSQETDNGIPIDNCYVSMLDNIKSQLLDPDSLQIDNVYYIVKGGGMAMIFDFRSKNTFGGYAQGWAVESDFNSDGSLMNSVWILEKNMYDTLVPALLSESNNPILYTPPK